MRTFNYTSLKNKTWDNETLNYISQIHEQKGKQTLYLRQKPKELEKLVEIAKIQSTEASNDIEGIRTTSTRLKQLMAEKTMPRTRDEKDIAGYRDALNLVHERFEYIAINSNDILQLHKIMFSPADSPFGGKYKNVQNYITATDVDGVAHTIFTPLDPFETPSAVDKICEEYNKAIGEGQVDPLILIPTFIHDFLCIHPFIDGNGRMSRLLTTLLLYRSGYYIGKYISLESKIANNKEKYYAALEASQIGWHEGKENVAPFIKYLLSTIVSAYRDFEDRAEIVTESTSSLNAVVKAISSTVGQFTKKDIIEKCPSVSAKTIERHLKRLCDLGTIKKYGSSRATYYVKNE